MIDWNFECILRLGSFTNLLGNKELKDYTIIFGMDRNVMKENYLKTRQTRNTGKIRRRKRQGD